MIYFEKIYNFTFGLVFSPALQYWGEITALNAMTQIFLNKGFFNLNTGEFELNSRESEIYTGESEINTGETELNTKEFELNSR